MRRTDGDGAALSRLVDEVERSSNSDPNACLVAGRRAMAAVRAAGDRSGEMQVSYFVGFAHHLLSQDDEAMSSMEQALGIARSSDDRGWEARIMGGLGAVHSGFGDNASAIELLEQSLAIRREVADPYGVAASLNNLGVTFEEMGLYPEHARDLLEEARTIFADLGSEHGQAASLCHLASLDTAESDRLATTDPEAARVVARRALAIAGQARAHAERMGDNARLLAEVMVKQARALMACGRADEAEAVLDEAAALDEQVGTTHLRLGLAAARGRLHRARGQLDAAVQVIEAGLAGNDLVRTFERMDLLGELVAIHEQRGELAEALGAHRRLLAATVELRDDAADRRARALNARLELDRAQVAAELERLRSERLELANRELTYAATHDGLTGLANRRSFDATLQARTGHPDAALTCLFGDLDHFKGVNDEFSHAVGDEVLRRVAQVVGAAVRGSDLVARIGGEEIAVLLADSDGHDGPRGDQKEVAEVCERIRTSIANHPWDEIAPGLQVTISIGAATRRRAESAAALVARADALLYAAKAAGRNRVATDAPPTGERPVPVG